ncbi:hypothetical protein NG895_02865, partial [Aeoliella sp. ICT_H6.2]
MSSKSTSAARDSPYGPNRKRRARSANTKHNLSYRPKIELLEDRRMLAIVTWDGGGDAVSWHDPANWDTDVLPGDVDDVIIDLPNDNTIEVTNDVLVNSVNSQEFVNIFSVSTFTVNSDSTFAGGVTVSASSTLNGTGDITLDGSSFTGGNGRIDGTGRLTVAAGAELNVVSSQTTIVSRTTDVFGTLAISSPANDFSGPRLVLDGVGDQVVVHAGGVMHLKGAAIISATSEGRILNEGSLLRTGPGIVQLTAEVDNRGDAQLLGGELQINGGGSSSRAINVEADATLNLRGGFSFTSPVAVTGEGRLEITGGAHDFTGSDILVSGSATFVSSTVTIANTLPAELEIDQIRVSTVIFNADQTVDSVDADFGTISGSGNLTFTGMSRFNQSRLTGTGAVIFAEASTINVFSLGVTIEPPVENKGHVRAFGDARFNQGLVNRPEATFELLNSASESFTAAPLVNEGTLRKTGDGQALFSSTSFIENHGSIEVASGELILPAGSTTTSIDVPIDTTLR